MSNNTMYSDHVSVYPGIYERSWSEKEFDNELHKTNVKVKIPPAQLKQFSDHYRIDIAIPGYNKESFFIHTNGRMLSITGMNKKHEDGYESNFHVTETSCECIKTNLILPADADTDFVSAEYKNGILRIYLPTSTQSIGNGSKDIIVY